MTSKIFLLINLLNCFQLIHTNEPLYFGVINHNTQWQFHCPLTQPKILNPPINDQPLISYECPNQLSAMEILPLEIDFTFLCRMPSRLVWIIIDLYQFNTFFWLIDRNNIDIKIEFNNQIQLNNSKTEAKNYTNRLILIDAFYIPIESINSILDKPIEINIQIQNLNRTNQCQFSVKDNILWKTFVENNCDSMKSKTIFTEHAKCDFYAPKPKSVDIGFQVQIENESIPATTTQSYDFQRTIDMKSTTISMPYHSLIEENYRLLLILTARSTTNSTLLKLTFIVSILILLLLIIFFLYTLCYHHRQRLKSSSSIRKSSLLL